jgi:hypothetical protein
MLRKSIVFVGLWLGFLCLGSAAAFASGHGGLSYNFGPSFSAGAGIGFSMRDVHVIKDDGDSDEVFASSFLAKIDAAPIRYLDFYVIAGVGEAQLADGEFKGTLGFSWGVGLRPQLFPLTLRSPVNITLDGQFLETFTYDNDVAGRLREIQASLMVAYVMKSLAPYGGIKYDRAWMQLDGKKNDVIGDLEWGAFIGCDYFVTQNVFFNLELNIFAETAAFLSAGYKY